MRTVIFLLYFLMFENLFLSASEQIDSTIYSNKDNFIFLNTSSALVGDIWNMNNKWLVLGYEKDFRLKLSTNISIGYVIHFPENKNSIISLPFVKNSKGFDLSPEIKKYIKNRMYLGLQLYFQNTMTKRTQSVLDYVTYNPYEIFHYTILR